MVITLHVAAGTDVGKHREHNEDSLLVINLPTDGSELAQTVAPGAQATFSLSKRGCVFGVCDGMGGASFGEVASGMAVTIIPAYLQACTASNHKGLVRDVELAVKRANQGIFTEAQRNIWRKGMGTTATVAALIDDHLVIGQVGDSRAYVLRGDRLTQVTRDHNLVEAVMESHPGMTEDEALAHIGGATNIISRSVGTREDVDVDICVFRLCCNDTVLICSDGLSGMIKDDVIQEALRLGGIDAVRKLIDAANNAGGNDNITAIVARFTGDSLMDPDVFREKVPGRCRAEARGRAAIPTLREAPMPVLISAPVNRSIPPSAPSAPLIHSARPDRFDPTPEDSAAQIARDWKNMSRWLPLLGIVIVCGLLVGARYVSLAMFVSPDGVDGGVQQEEPITTSVAGTSAASPLQPILRMCMPMTPGLLSGMTGGRLTDPKRFDEGIARSAGFGTTFLVRHCPRGTRRTSGPSDVSKCQICPVD